MEYGSCPAFAAGMAKVSKRPFIRGSQGTQRGRGSIWNQKCSETETRSSLWNSTVPSFIRTSILTLNQRSLIAI